MFTKRLEPLSPFRAGVLLAVARIPRCEAVVLDILRKRLQRYSKFMAASAESPWLQLQVLVTMCCCCCCRWLG
jgi:hypothetical protein